MKRLWILLIPFLLGAAPQRLFTYTANTTIESSAVTANEDEIFTYLQAGVDTYSPLSITNADISASAGIDDAKLSLGNIAQAVQFDGAVVFGNNVTFASQTIADLGTVTTGVITAITLNAGELNGVNVGQTTPSGRIRTEEFQATGNIDLAGSTTSDAGSVTTIDINGGTMDGVQVGGTTATGELLVNNASDAADGLGDQGTSGQFLQSAGAGSNPTFADPPVKFVSKSTWSAGQNSGNITISDGAKYRVVMKAQVDGSDVKFDLRFNSDSNSKYGNTGEAITGSTEIDLTGGAVVDSGGDMIADFIIDADGYAWDVLVTGSGTYKANGGNITTATITGAYDNDTTITDFEIVTSGQNSTGEVLLYLLSES